MLSVLPFASPRQWLNPRNDGCSCKDYICYLFIIMQLLRFLDHFMLRLALCPRHLLFLIRPTLRLLPRQPGGRVTVRSWARKGPLSEADNISAKGMELKQNGAFMKGLDESRLTLALSLSRLSRTGSLSFCSRQPDSRVAVCSWVGSLLPGAGSRY
jgi:hypothetical protein